MACCDCCCPPGEECCKAPGPTGICCLPSQCCGTEEEPECCSPSEFCCETVCCPNDYICCEGVCCDEGECCVDGECGPCPECEGPCASTEECQSAGEDCVCDPSYFDDPPFSGGDTFQVAGSDGTETQEDICEQWRLFSAEPCEACEAQYEGGEFWSINCRQCFVSVLP
jgi:hypothetical protein